MAFTGDREWTIMIYTMADDPSLRDAANDTLSQIAAVPLFKTKVVLQATFASTLVDPIRRYDFEVSKGRRNLQRKVDPKTHLEFSAQRNLSPSRNLTAFLKWAQDAYPAKRYCVVIQGHAWGADYRMPSLSVHETKRSHTIQHPDCRLIFGNPASKNRLTNKQLSDALSKAVIANRFDLLALDSCLMCMAEICYQFRNCVKTMIAPEGYGPIAGWPFGRILPIFERYSTIYTTKLAKLALREYSEIYANFRGDIKLTIAACDLRYSSELAQAVKTLSGALIQGMESNPYTRSAIIRTRVDSAYYRFPAYIDLYDFCERLADKLPKNLIKNACLQVMTAIRNRFVSTCDLRRERTNSHGLSIFFPGWQVGRRFVETSEPQRFHFVVATPRNLQAATKFIKDAYSEHDFTNVTGWKQFLLHFISARHVRKAYGQRP